MASITGIVTKAQTDKLGRPYMVINDREGIDNGKNWHVVIYARKDAAEAIEAIARAKPGDGAYAIGQITGDGVAKIRAVQVRIFRIGAEAPPA